MTPRKVVAGYSLLYPHLDVIHYRIDDQGGVWSRTSGHTTWHEEQPLPPREDAGEIAPTEDERLRIQRLVDECKRLRFSLRRVRAAVGFTVDVKSGFCMNTESSIAAMNRLEAINKEPMP